MGAVQQDPTPDLNPETLAALSALMVAQAQEIFVHKSIQGKCVTCFSMIGFIVCSIITSSRC